MDESWTDDIPVCDKSDVGYCANQLYKADGFKKPMHDYHGKFFHLKYDNNMYLYGVFDGFDGNLAAGFTCQRLPHEVLFDDRWKAPGPPKPDTVREILRDAFPNADREYSCHVSRIDKECAPRVAAAGTQHSGEQWKRCGCSAAVALIYQNSLYTANVGSTRILLCMWEGRKLRVLPLSVDHVPSNVEETMRLRKAGHDTSGPVTRCLGALNRKNEPNEIIADPYVSNGDIKLEGNQCFLVIASAALFEALGQVRDSQNLNFDLADLIAQELQNQENIHAVAQAVVDSILRQHHARYMVSKSNQHSLNCHEDMTLLVCDLRTKSSAPAAAPLTPTEPVRIPAYVSFDEYYNMKQSEQDRLVYV